ncbi:MAG: hypothetical protein LH660_15995 [Phormidesmis sp. CAN_BIN36]|nr:hypothetical protein [Phormidesmis sp. CAN_BIN36]
MFTLIAFFVASLIAIFVLESQVCPLDDSAKWGQNSELQPIAVPVTQSSIRR